MGLASEWNIGMASAGSQSLVGGSGSNNISILKWTFPKIMQYSTEMNFAHDSSFSTLNLQNFQQYFNIEVHSGR